MKPASQDSSSMTALTGLLRTGDHIAAGGGAAAPAQQAAHALQEALVGVETDSPLAEVSKAPSVPAVRRSAPW